MSQETAHDLGVVIDSQLSLSAQVAAVFRSGYQLRQLRPLVRSMSAEAVKKLVQAFIPCNLDYCNFLFYGITKRPRVS